MTPRALALSLQTRVELELAWRTRGEAFADGRITDHEALEYIKMSNRALGGHRGHRWLKRRALWNIPRGLDWPIPYPIFLPQLHGIIGSLLFLVFGVRDMAGWVSVACYPEDPTGQFDRPVPVPSHLDVVSALALSGLTYHGLCYYRRTDQFLMDAVERIGGSSISYRTRPFLAWLERRNFLGVRDDDLS